MITYEEAEQQVANQLFLRHGLVMNKDYVNGIHVGMDINASYSGTGFWSRPTGKQTITVGTWGDSERRINFRQKNDGTFNYDKIADKIAERYQSGIRKIKKRQETQTKEQQYDSMIDRAVEKHGIYKYGSVLKKRYSKKYDALYGLDLTFNVKSNEQIDALITLAKELGIKIN